MDYDWTALPDELKRRANEVYQAAGLDLGLLHDIAHRLETSRTVSFDHDQYFNGIRFDAGEYLIKRIGPPHVNPTF